MGKLRIHPACPPERLLDFAFGAFAGVDRPGPRPSWDDPQEPLGQRLARGYARDVGLRLIPMSVCFSEREAEEEPVDYQLTLLPYAGRPHG